LLSTSLKKKANNSSAFIAKKVRFLIMQEADAVVADLEEVLSAVWLSAPSEAQQAFLIEFIDLIKNLFDSTIG
jgi:hypothetical protein